MLTDSQLLRIQAASGLVFRVFVLVHLANTAFAMAGPEAYDGFQHVVREAYQWPALEILLVALPLGVHFAAAVTRILRSGLRRPGQTRGRCSIGSPGTTCCSSVWGVRGPAALRGGAGFWAPVALATAAVSARAGRAPEAGR